MIEHEKMIVEALPSLYPLQKFEEDAVHAVIDALPHWISVTERLPDIGADVMFSVGKMYCAEGCLRSDGDWRQFRWDAIIPKHLVDAWCELPEPFKGVTE